MQQYVNNLLLNAHKIIKKSRGIKGDTSFLLQRF